MKNKKIIKLLTLVLTFVFFTALALNVAADAGDSAYSIGPNVPDKAINRRDAASSDSSAIDGNNNNGGTDAINGTSNQTGAVDEALKDASDAVNDAKDTVEDAIDETAGSSIMGIVIAILIAVAIIIIIMVMVSKNNGKYNRK